MLKQLVRIFFKNNNFRRYDDLDLHDTDNWKSRWTQTIFHLSSGRSVPIAFKQELPSLIFPSFYSFQASTIWSVRWHRKVWDNRQNSGNPVTRFCIVRSPMIDLSVENMQEQFIFDAVTKGWCHSEQRSFDLDLLNTRYWLHEERRIFRLANLKQLKLHRINAESYSTSTLRPNSTKFPEWMLRDATHCISVLKKNKTDQQIVQFVKTAPG